uniref:Protein kinase domain-containing protein n=1 Tax=Caenorhabditis japonica TaxID=281687 RepID=A0A8R1DYQ0_CAEJA
MDGGKILETTISWTADDKDPRREGFYVRYTAINATCQKHFPGYFTSSILPDERSLTIPSAFNGHALVINHSCSYQLQIRAKPYPPGDANYIIEKRHTVPDCIEKYCSCRPGDVAVIKNVSVDAYYRLNWKFEDVKGKEYTFYVDVYERIALPILKKKDSNEDADEYTYRIANPESYEISSKTAMTGPHTFQFALPLQFSPLQHYKIGIFAVDDSFCHNEDVFHLFNATNSTTSEAVATSSMVDGKEKEKEEDVRPMSATAITKTTVLMNSSFIIIFLLIVACASPICTVFVLILLKRKFDGYWLLARPKNPRSCPKCEMRKKLKRIAIEFRACAKSLWHTAHWLLAKHSALGRFESRHFESGLFEGEGAFGQVFKGILRGPNGQVVPVAVKQLKANAIDEEKEEFVREIQMMQTVGQHDNIVTMYGYCMDDQLQCMIMEYVPYGDLKHYLQNMRKEKDSESSIDSAEFFTFAGQVACGMAHLESVGIIHRDLAARNILDESSNLSAEKNRQDKMLNDLEKQYAVARETAHLGRGNGLGFGH